MSYYFPQEQSIQKRMGDEVKPVLKTIATRFIADNPPVPVTFFLRSRDNFHISHDYMEEIKFHEKFPGMEEEAYAYAWAELTPPQKGPFHFRFYAYGPVSIYVNGAFSYRTSHTQGRFPEQITDVCLNLEEGANSLLFQCIKTPLGCGFGIGSSSYKGRRIQFFGPSKEHQGLSGFIYTAPMKQPLETLPKLGEAVNAAGKLWYPNIIWKEEESRLTLSERFYGLKDKLVLAAARICLYTDGYCRFIVEDSAAWIYVDGRKQDCSGKVFLTGGTHIVTALGTNPGVKLLDMEGNEIKPICPVHLFGDRELSWIYAGPFDSREDLDLETALTFQKPIKTGKETTFWRLDMPQMFLRPFNEGALYGEWNYPLGVTLYGLMQTFRTLKDESVGAYVEGHMRKATDFYEYCMWDKETYGAAPFLNQLTTMDSLDDCGSFASAMLEVMKDYPLPEGMKLAKLVADYIHKMQYRLPDGTFYRNHSYMPVMNETMWADDMYMSIPFLCRYYELSKEEGYLEDAVLQVKNFYRYLYMPELQIMSHIYDTHYQVQTKVPWGRGNGWALFSIAELLAILPEEHPDRKTILAMFRNLCEGYKKLQGLDGMWHQVLTFPHSYQETSCSAMFLYGFARGIRYGWLERENYEECVERGWKALCRTAIDWKGNIYGVCRGSGYSFSKEYYANDLGWNFNDTHGTGIVLLAGIEVEKMRQRSKDIS